MPKQTRRRTAVLETSAGGVVHRKVGGAPHVLLIRDPYGHWGLPKGHLEAGESAEQAALREVQEETGLRMLRLGPRIRTIDWYFNSGRQLVHKYCHFYLIEAPTGEAVPQTSEGITECEWLPYDAALERIGYGNARQVLRQAGEVMGWPRGGP